VSSSSFAFPLAPVQRYFGPATLDGGKTAKLKKRKAYLAVITRWLPAEDGDLFHAVHDDGDEEDLEEHEARKSGALYNRQPEAQRKKHEILCAKREKQLKAEAKARLPKKPLSAYHLFGADARAELAQTQPGLPPPEVLKRIAALWRELPDADRAEYDHKASEEVKRYVSECEAQGIDPGKAARLASGPEPPLSALGFFQARCEAAMGVSLSVKCVSEQLASEVDGMPKSVAKLLQAGFDVLSYEERDELDDLAAIDAERYEEELAAYQAAAAKRRKTGAGGSQARGEGAAADDDDDDAGADEVDAPSAAAAAAADSSQVVVKVRGVKRPRG
jgi:transcription factor A